MTHIWTKADIHIHTNHSDGAASVADVLRYVADHTDLRIIAITDHDTITGALEARQLASAYGLEVIVGEEVSTREGHLLALFIEQELPPHRPAAETIAAVHGQGGLCIAAHPYAHGVPSLGFAGLYERYKALTCDWPLDGIESFNASLWLPHSNTAAAIAATELGLAACGGSDSHLLQTIGRAYTRFPGSSAEDLRRAIQTRQTQPGGSYWHWTHTATLAAELTRRELRGFARRAVRPSIP